jgi:hypothetical protein
MLGLVLVRMRRAKVWIVAGIAVTIVPMEELRNVGAGRQRYSDSGTAGVFRIVEE